MHNLNTINRVPSKAVMLDALERFDRSRPRTLTAHDKKAFGSIVPFKDAEKVLTKEIDAASAAQTMAALEAIQADGRVHAQAASDAAIKIAEFIAQGHWDYAAAMIFALHPSTWKFTVTTNGNVDMMSITLNDTSPLFDIPWLAGHIENRQMSGCETNVIIDVICPDAGLFAFEDELSDFCDQLDEQATKVLNTANLVYLASIDDMDEDDASQIREAIEIHDAITEIRADAALFRTVSRQEFTRFQERLRRAAFGFVILKHEMGFREGADALDLLEEKHGCNEVTS